MVDGPVFELQPQSLSWRVGAAGLAGIDATLAVVGAADGVDHAVSADEPHGLERSAAGAMLVEVVLAC